MGLINQAVSLPKSAFDFVMPRSGCRLPRACALLVAGRETWKQQKQNEKKTNEHRIRLKGRLPSCKGLRHEPHPLHIQTLFKIIPMFSVFLCYK